MTKKLLLVDGANCLFRAFYAIPHLSNQNNLPTNALFGLAQTLLKLRDRHMPDYMIVCLDTKETTHRKKMYPKYKANRQEPPDELKMQFPYVNSVIKAMGIPLIAAPGFEADDIIGTLSKQYCDKMDVVIISSDKDLMQLIEPGISMIDDMRNQQVDREFVCQKFGVYPEQMIDFLALAGDSSDNIPGVPSVGVKTAAKLLREYNTLDNVLSNAKNIKGKLGEKLRDHVDDALLSKQLVTIDTHMSLSISLEDMILRPPGEDDPDNVIDEVGLARLIGPVEKKKQSLNNNILSISSQEKLDQWLLSGKDLKDQAAVAINVHDDHYVISITYAVNHAALIHCEKISALEDDLFSNITPSFVFNDVIVQLLTYGCEHYIHWIIYDINAFISKYNLHDYFDKMLFFDVLLASYVIDPTDNRHVGSLADKYLDVFFQELETPTKKTKSTLSKDDVLASLSQKSNILYQLKSPLCDALQKNNLMDLYESIELPLASILLTMQHAGVCIDSECLNEFNEQLSERMSVLENSIYELVGEPFNINSPKQLGVILFEKLQFKGSKKTKTGYSTSQSVLEKLALTHELPGKILDFRHLSKLKSTYCDGLLAQINPDTGRVHTVFNQMRTATGRLSSSDPNLQNIPIRTTDGKRIRQAFIASPGHVLLSADYSQIELRLLAHLSGEEALIQAFNEDKDSHALTAAAIFDCDVSEIDSSQRSIGKVVNFATIYGQGAFGLSKQLDIHVSEAQSYIDGYFANYPLVVKYRDSILEQAKEDGYVTTMMNRIRYLPDLNASNYQLRQLAERMAFNTVIQGSAADLIKKAMIQIAENLTGISPTSSLLIQVHDELILDVAISDYDAVAAFVIKKMTYVCPLLVPLTVHVGSGKSWADAH